MAAKKSVQLSGVVVAESAICSIDPDEGVLMYRGYDIADLAEHSTYEETALLLLDGELPSSDALASFESELAEQRQLPPETVELIDRSAAAAAPMDLLRTAVSTLAFSDPGSGKIDAESGRTTATRLIAQLPTIVGHYHRRREGLEPIAPDPSLSYAENFLTMLHGERPAGSPHRAEHLCCLLSAGRREPARQIARHSQIDRRRARTCRRDRIRHPSPRYSSSTFSR
jgi:citrate synthase